MTVNVLGTEYEIVVSNEASESYLKECDGFCDNSIKRVTVDELKGGGVGSKKNLEFQRKKNIRHELVHAFLFESGLAENSQWAYNEECVDWIASQFPKLLKAFEGVDAL